MKINRILLAGLGICVVVGIFAAFAITWPVGSDYYKVYHTASQRLNTGLTRLYDAGSPGYYNAPWLMLLIAPLSRLSPEVGQAALNTLSLTGICAAIYLVQTSGVEKKRLPALALVFALANLHTFDVLIRGQVDVIPLLGVVIGWRAIHARRPLLLSVGLSLMLVKPPNVALVGLLILISIRGWSLKARLAVWSVPLALALGSGLFIGFDWPLRLVRFSRESPLWEGLSVTLWRAADAVALPTWPFLIGATLLVFALLRMAWCEGPSLRIVSLALAVTLSITTYANDSHYILLIPAVLYLAWQDLRVAAVCWLFTWSPFVRLKYGFSAAWVDLIYPLAILIACLSYYSRTRGDGSVAGDTYPGA